MPAPKRKQQRLSAWINHGLQHGLSSAATISQVLDKLDVVAVQTSGYQHKLLVVRYTDGNGCAWVIYRAVNSSSRESQQLGKGCDSQLCALPNREWNDVGPFIHGGQGRAAAVSRTSAPQMP